MSKKSQTEIELWWMRNANDAGMGYREQTVRRLGRYSSADLEPLITAGLATFSAGFWITEKGREVLAECERLREAPEVRPTPSAPLSA